MYEVCKVAIHSRTMPPACLSIGSASTWHLAPKFGCQGCLGSGSGVGRSGRVVRWYHGGRLCGGRQL